MGVAVVLDDETTLERRVEADAHPAVRAALAHNRRVLFDARGTGRYLPAGRCADRQAPMASGSLDAEAGVDFAR